MQDSAPSTWSPRHVRVLGAAESAGAALRGLCLDPRQEDAFYLCDLDALLDRYRMWQRLWPGVVPYYAVKCNDTEAVIKTVAALGGGFDCATKEEIKKVTELGIDPSRIIYAHPLKPPSHLKYAKAKGVNFTVFDGEDELHKIKNIHPESKLMLRIRCDAESALSKLGDKFGVSAESDEPRQLLETARALGLHVMGVCFHVGSGAEGAEVFGEAVRLSRRVWDVAEELGFRMTTLNIGGGFPGNDDEESGKMAKILKDTIAELFGPDVTLISEPGRHFVCRAFTIAANVHSRRILRDASGDVSTVKYYINAGIHSGFKFFSKWKLRGEPLLSCNTPESAERYHSTVWGPTCDGADMIEGPYEMPLLDLNSWLVYRCMGAYTMTLSTGFNGFSALKTTTIASREAWSLLKDLHPFTEDSFYHGDKREEQCGVTRTH